MKDKKIYICNDYLTDIDGIKLLLEKEKDFDMIKYPFIKNILILNIPIMESNNDGKYYYDYELIRDCDIASDFILLGENLDVSFTFICGLYEYQPDDIKEIILASCMYSPIKIRITFNNYNNDDDDNLKKEIKISYNKNLCKRNDSYFLLKNKIITSSIIYENGVCIKNT